MSWTAPLQEASPEPAPAFYSLSQGEHGTPIAAVAISQCDAMEGVDGNRIPLSSKEEQEILERVTVRCASILALPILSG